MGLCAVAPKEEVPLYDDGPTCPYRVKPSELFAMNEVRPSGGHVSLPLLARRL